MPNVAALESGWPARAPCDCCTNCLSVVYVVKRTAEFAPWRIICAARPAVSDAAHGERGGGKGEGTHDGEEAAVHAAEAFFAHDAGRAVHEATEARARRLGVVDELRPARAGRAQWRNGEGGGRGSVVVRH